MSLGKLEDITPISLLLCACTHTHTHSTQSLNSMDGETGPQWKWDWEVDSRPFLPHTRESQRLHRKALLLKSLCQTLLILHSLLLYFLPSPQAISFPLASTHSVRLLNLTLLVFSSYMNLHVPLEAKQNSCCVINRLRSVFCITHLSPASSTPLKYINKLYPLSSIIWF